MNLVDYIIIGVVAVSILFGLYRGFLSSVLNTGGLLISFAVSFWLYPKLGALIQHNPQLQRTLLTYTDASSRLGSMDTAIMNVATLTRDKIAEIVDKVSLPEPFSELLRNNLSGRIYNGISSVSEYVSETIVTACINIICFLLCLAAVYIILSLVGSLLRAVFKLPVLKQMDALAGALMGLLRGLLLVYALFVLLPMVQTMVPLQAVDELMAQSVLAPYFANPNLVLAVLREHL